MEVQVADSGPCRKSLTITIAPEQIRDHIDEAYKSAAGQVQLKGFRTGKVPRKVLEKKFGEAILQEAKENLLHRCFEDACKQEKIDFIGQPNVEGVPEEPLNKDSSLQFQVHLNVRPEFKLKQVKGIEVTHDDTAVNDEDVQKGLDQLAAQKRSLKPVTDAVEDGDFVKADLIFKHEGEMVHERKAAQLSTTIPLAGADPQHFTDSLRGAEVGKTIELELKFPDNFEKEDYRGKDGKAEMSILEVMRVIPAPIDDELAKGYDFETLDAMKEALQKRIGEEKVTAEESRQENHIIEAILNENPFDLPEALVEDQANHLLSQAGQQMKQQGSDEETIKAELEKNKDSAKEEAVQRLRVFFLLDAITKDQKIFITESDVDVALRNIAAQNHASYEDVRKHYEEQNMLDDLRMGLKEQKVRKFLRENASVTNK